MAEATPIHVVAVKSYSGPKRGEALPSGLKPQVGPLKFKKRQVMTLIDWDEPTDYILAYYTAKDHTHNGWLPADFVRVLRDGECSDVCAASHTASIAPDSSPQAPSAGDERAGLKSPRHGQLGKADGTPGRSSSAVRSSEAASTPTTPLGIRRDKKDGHDGKPSFATFRSSSVGNLREMGDSEELNSATKSLAISNSSEKARRKSCVSTRPNGSDTPPPVRSPLGRKRAPLDGVPVVDITVEKEKEKEKEKDESKGKIETAVFSLFSSMDQVRNGAVRTGSAASSAVMATLGGTKDSKDSKKRVQTLEELLRSQSGNARGEFSGVPLNEVQPVDKRGIPVLVTTIIKHLRSHGLSQENLFRASGHGQEVREIKRRFDAGEVVDLSKTRDIHSSAAVLKLFLRELSEPLLTYDLYSSFAASLELPTEERRLEHFTYLLELLPPQNYNVTACLAGFLYEAVQRANENTLTLVQASRIFGQSFCRLNDYTIDRDELEKSYMVTQHLIVLHAKLFTDYLDARDTDAERLRFTKRKKEKEMMENYLKKESKERQKQEKRSRKKKKQDKRKKSDEDVTLQGGGGGKAVSRLAGTSSPSPFDINSPKVGRTLPVESKVLDSVSPPASASPSLRRNRRITARELMLSRELVNVESGMEGGRSIGDAAGLASRPVHSRAFSSHRRSSSAAESLSPSPSRMVGTPPVISSDEEGEPVKRRAAVPLSEMLSSPLPSAHADSEGNVWKTMFFVLLALSVASHVLPWLVV